MNLNAVTDKNGICTWVGAVQEMKKMGGKVAAV